MNPHHEDVVDSSLWQTTHWLIRWINKSKPDQRQDLYIFRIQLVQLAFNSWWQARQKWVQVTWWQYNVIPPVTDHDQMCLYTINFGRIWGDFSCYIFTMWLVMKPFSCFRSTLTAIRAVLSIQLEETSLTAYHGIFDILPIVQHGKFCDSVPPLLRCNIHWSWAEHVRVPYWVLRGTLVSRQSRRDLVCLEI